MVGDPDPEELHRSLKGRPNADKSGRRDGAEKGRAEFVAPLQYVDYLHGSNGDAVEGTRV